MPHDKPQQRQDFNPKPAAAPRDKRAAKEAEHPVAADVRRRMTQGSQRVVLVPNAVLPKRKRPLPFRPPPYVGDYPLRHLMQRQNQNTRHRVRRPRSTGERKREVNP